MGNRGDPSQRGPVVPENPAPLATDQTWNMPFNGLQIDADNGAGLWTMDDTGLEFPSLNIYGEIGGVDPMPPQPWDVFDLGRAERLPQQDLLDRL